MIELGNGFALRLAEPGDDAAIAAMSVGLYREDPGAREVTEADVLRTLAHFRAHPDRGRAVVFLHEGVPAGYSFVCAFWSNELGGLLTIVDELYLSAFARGRGVGTAFFSQLARGAIGPFKDLVAMDLEVTPDNSRARALYARLGFAPQKNGSMRKRL